MIPISLGRRHQHQHDHPHLLAGVEGAEPHVEAEAKAYFNPYKLRESMQKYVLLLMMELNIQYGTI